MPRCFFCRIEIDQGVRCGQCEERTVGFAYGEGLAADVNQFTNLKKLQRKKRPQ